MCVLEYLHPLQYESGNDCYSGPWTDDDLVLVTCAHDRFLTKSPILAKCYLRDEVFVCPRSALQLDNHTDWLGLPWHTSSSLVYPRIHKLAKSCRKQPHLINLGGTSYLATRTANFTLEHLQHPLRLRPLHIYDLPCTSSVMQAAGSGQCPKAISIKTPLVTNLTLSYGDWTVLLDNSTKFELPLVDLKIPRPTKFNKTVLKSLDETYNALDGQLSSQISKVKADISKIKETNLMESQQIMLYFTFSLAICELLIIIGIVMYLRKKAPSPPTHHQLPPLCLEPNSAYIKPTAELAEPAELTYNTIHRLPYAQKA